MGKRPSFPVRDGPRPLGGTVVARGATADHVPAGTAGTRRQLGEGPLPYRLLPTLSGVEAALAVLRRGTASAEGTGRLTTAVNRGLDVLRSLPPVGPWPDTAAAEILVPSLIAKINEKLGSPATGEDMPSFGGRRLAVPGGFHESAPASVARRYESAGSLPIKFHHTFEGIDSYIPPALVPDVEGLLGSSPAATAARAMRSPDTTAKAVADLTAVAQRYGGLFPEAAPLRVVERLWVAAALARAHLPVAALPTVRGWAEEIYDSQGVRGAPGLMTDADDTAMAVLVASLVGLPYDPAPLDLFHNGSHYDCYIGEDTGSVTANAHALQALVSYLRRCPTAEHTYGPRAAKLCDWLTGQQRPEGHWTDKWHASPTTPPRGASPRSHSTAATKRPGPSGGPPRGPLRLSAPTAPGVCGAAPSKRPHTPSKSC